MGAQEHAPSRAGDAPYPPRLRAVPAGSIPVLLVAALTLIAVIPALMVHASNFLGRPGGCGVGRGSLFVPIVLDTTVLAGWLLLEALACWLRDGHGVPWPLGSALRIVRATLAGAIFLACSGPWLQLQFEQAGWLRFGEWVLPR